MAATPKPQLFFSDSCRDCGIRQVTLPPALPNIGDDFDWLTRDYDGFRLFIMEELAGRFPERSRWTVADIEVILAEAFAVILDQCSDTLDRVHAEAFLDSARRPDSVRRLLKLIGYDAVKAHYLPKWSSEVLVIHLLNTQSIDTTTIDFSLDLSLTQNLQKLLVWLGHSPDVLGVQPRLSNRATEAQFLNLLGFVATSLLEALDLEIPEHRLFATQQLERQWRDNSFDMDLARQNGPRAVHVNRRMVTLDDYRERSEEHPAVLRAASLQRWTGSWNTVEITPVLINNATIDQTVASSLTGLALDEFQLSVDQFHWNNNVAPVDWGDSVTFRTLLKSLIDEMRLVGQEVWLRDAKPVGISINLSIRLDDNYFQSEISQAISAAMGTGAEGFFQPGRLAFGADLYASDLIHWLMQIEGIEAVCLNQFKRVGVRYPDQSGSGVIQLNGQQIARCDNDFEQPHLGYWRQSLHGGQRG